MSELQSHQERVRIERADLGEKLTKLLEFIDGEVFDSLDEAEQDRLSRQATIMGEYAAVLDERIAAF